MQYQVPWDRETQFHWMNFSKFSLFVASFSLIPMAHSKTFKVKFSSDSFWIFHSQNQNLFTFKVFLFVCNWKWEQITSLSASLPVNIVVCSDNFLDKALMRLYYLQWMYWSVPGEFQVCLIASSSLWIIIVHRFILIRILLHWQMLFDRVLPEWYLMLDKEFLYSFLSSCWRGALFWVILILIDLLAAMDGTLTLLILGWIPNHYILCLQIVKK